MNRVGCDQTQQANNFPPVRSRDVAGLYNGEITPQLVHRNACASMSLHMSKTSRIEFTLIFKNPDSTAEK